MATPPVEQLETEDIQGLVVRGYGPLKEASFVLLAVSDAKAARAYLRELAGRINTASESPEHFAIQIAFTAPGLTALGMPDEIHKTFSREFLEGMHDDVRAISVGDIGANDPKDWKWGKSGVDAMLMIYAKDGTRIDDEKSKIAGFTIVDSNGPGRNTITLADNKEHFGWRDGLSLPAIDGVPEKHPRKKHPETWTTPAIKPGEFVLGYKNEYNCLTESPYVDPKHFPNAELPALPNGMKDLGRNGTYLVYRQMTQDVHALWDYLARESKEPGGDRDTKAIALGAKMVGRWPSGAPLMVAPDRDEPAKAESNKFNYTAEDPDGLKCPLGAHIRRANPRDRLALDRNRDDSIEMVRKHQMIRRGRAFGAPVDASMDPKKLIAAPKDEVSRGLHFICLVGHISRQFEFVQRAWVHSANFASLFNDGDPITGTRQTTDPRNDQFTCPAEPFRRRYKAMPAFTKLVGGAYFFLPSISALRFIAEDR